MEQHGKRLAPGQVRDAIIGILADRATPLSVGEICQMAKEEIGDVPESSIRSYLLLNTPGKFRRKGRGKYELAEPTGKFRVPGETGNAPEFGESEGLWDGSSAVKIEPEAPTFRFGKAEIVCQDCFEWIASRPDLSIHAIVTDPPYGIKEYMPEELSKLRAGKGGVWRMPPSFDGNRRSPLPRFTVLDSAGLAGVRLFFLRWGRAVLPKLVPGANVLVAANPLLSAIVSQALSDAGLERRGELVRLTMTMRGGDRPKNAEREFRDVSVMPRSMWEPWLMFRRPLEGRVQDNLRKWGTGGFRRIDSDHPFGDVVKSSPTNRTERALANHPSLKPQSFLRKIVRAALPLGKGVVADTFAGSGSTLAAAEAVGYESVGTERDEAYWKLACEAIPRLCALETGRNADDMAACAGKRGSGRGAKKTAPSTAMPCTANLPLVF